MTDNNTKKCSQNTGFDYCFWAKLLVAIPVIPFLAITVASHFEDDYSQAMAAVLTVIAVVLIARWIDRIPALNKKIR